MGDRIDQEWSQQLRSELPSLLDDHQKQEFRGHLTAAFMLSRPEADACITALSALKSNERALAGDVLRDSLPDKMKDKFRQMAVDDLMERVSAQDGASAAPVHHPAAPKR